MRRALVGLAVAAALAVAAPAGADLWQLETDDPLAEGDALLRRSFEARDGHDYLKSRRLAQRAVRAYEEAARAPKAAAEAHFRAAETLYAFFVHDSESPDARTVLRAIEHWEAFERAAPRDSRVPSMLFRRSIARTKIGSDEQLRLALRDYEHISSLSPASDRDRPLVLSNAAELEMTLGDLDDAIELYEQALALESKALYGYGLAVALDRDGQERRAREVMSFYAASNHLRDLHDSGVFFIPRGDIHYYLALGYESLGRYGEAAEQYQAFLHFLPSSRYAPRARAHLKEMRTRAKRERPSTDEQWRKRWTF